MNFEITILGCGSASPRVDRMPTAHHIKIHNQYLLIDCGEGTQFQLQKFGISAHKIDHIFISHLHGDHFFGLIGLLSTLSMLERTNPLYIYAPAGLSEMIYAQTSYNKAPIKFPINFVELHTDKSELILDHKHFSVFTIPLSHGIPCAGFHVIEKNTKCKLKKELLPSDISLSHIKQLTNGIDVIDDNGEVLYPISKYTYAKQAPLSYTYISDSEYLPSIATYVKQTTLLYHEATFLEDLSHRAKSTKHSTASDAAKIASLCQAKQLIIGHFSSRYDELGHFLSEAQQIFPNTILAYDGLKISIKTTN